MARAHGNNILKRASAMQRSTRSLHASMDFWKTSGNESTDHSTHHTWGKPELFVSERLLGSLHGIGKTCARWELLANPVIGPLQVVEQARIDGYKVRDMKCCTSCGAKIIRFVRRGDIHDGPSMVECDVLCKSWRREQQMNSCSTCTCVVMCGPAPQRKPR